MHSAKRPSLPSITLTICNGVLKLLSWRNPIVSFDWSYLCLKAAVMPRKPLPRLPTNVLYTSIHGHMPSRLGQSVWSKTPKPGCVHVNEQIRFRLLGFSNNAKIAWGSPNVFLSLCFLIFQKGDGIFQSVPVPKRRAAMLWYRMVMHITLKMMMIMVSLLFVVFVVVVRNRCC